MVTVRIFGSILAVLLLVADLATPARAQTTKLQCGSRQLRALANGATHQYEFDVRSGESVSLDLVDAADPLGGELGHRLYDPDGFLIDEDCNYGFDLVDADTGTYSFEVYRCLGRGATQYAISLFAIGETINGQPACGRPLSCQQDHVEGSFTDLDPGPDLRSGVTDAYLFTQPSRRRTLISVGDISNRIGLLELRVYDEYGDLLYDTCDGSVEDVLSAGTYTVLINDCLGMDTGSYRIIFDRGDCPVAGNDECSAARTITQPSFIEVVSTEEADRSPLDPIPMCGNGLRESSVWYRYTPPRNGTLLLDTFGSTYDTIVSAYTGACGSFTPVSGGCNDNAGGPTSQLSIPVSGGVPHSFMVTARPGDDEFTYTLAFALSFVDGSVEPTPTPTAASGDCCSERSDERGCEEASCQSCVCGVDSYCCLEDWDEFCADTAFDQCAASCSCATGTTPSPTNTPTRTPTTPAVATPTVTVTRTGGPSCEGDCDGNGGVTVEELIRGVNIAQGAAPLSNCPAFDTSGEGLVTVDELVRAVFRGLNGCD